LQPSQRDPTAPTHHFKALNSYKKVKFSDGFVFPKTEFKE